MRKFNRIRPIPLSIAALMFVLSNTQAQTADPLQVLKEETAHTKRTWRYPIGTSFTTTYEEFELNSCTLTFKTKTLPKSDHDPQKILFKPETYRYAFPLKSADARLEWLDTYNSYVISLSGPDGVIAIEDSRPTPFFIKTVKGNTGPAPNVSIPFANENSAKRVKMALQGAINACGGSENPIQKMNSAAKNKEDLKPNTNDETYKVKVNVDLVVAKCRQMLQSLADPVQVIHPDIADARPLRSNINKNKRYVPQLRVLDQQVLHPRRHHGYAFHSPFRHAPD